MTIDQSKLAVNLASYSGINSGLINFMPVQTAVYKLKLTLKFYLPLSEHTHCESDLLSCQKLTLKI